MGIQGLIPLLKSIHRARHIADFKGQTIGIDAYGWLHRGAIACAIDLALGKPTTKYVDFCINRVRMLLHFGVIPYLVFDGGMLPSKAGTEAGREVKREETRKTGLELLSLKKTAEAYAELRKAIDVTPTMAAQVMEACRGLDVQCVVAPYEADAQLYYMERTGLISGIISEDSDLLVFGCRSLITKLDEYGSCVEINREDLPSNRDVSFAGWSDEDFRNMAILSGCDYLENIPNVGLRTAHSLIRKHKTVDRILRVLRFDGKYNVPQGYEGQFERAVTTFKYQRVWCPKQQRLVNCNELEGELTPEQELYIGPELDQETAKLVAEGKMDPITKMAIVLNQQQKRTFIPPPQQTFSAPVKPERSITSFFKPQTTPQRPTTLQSTKNHGVQSAPATAPTRTMTPTALTTRTPTAVATTTPTPTTLKRAAPTATPVQPIKKTSVCFDDDTLPEYSPFFGPPKTVAKTQTKTVTQTKSTTTTKPRTTPVKSKISGGGTLQMAAKEKREKALALPPPEAASTSPIEVAAGTCMKSTSTSTSASTSTSLSLTTTSTYTSTSTSTINNQPSNESINSSKESIIPASSPPPSEPITPAPLPSPPVEVKESSPAAPEEEDAESLSLQKVVEGWKQKFSFGVGTTTATSTSSRTTKKTSTTTRTPRRTSTGLSERSGSFNSSFNSQDLPSYSQASSTGTPTAKRKASRQSLSGAMKENERPGTKKAVANVSGVEWPEFVGGKRGFKGAAFGGRR